MLLIEPQEFLGIESRSRLVDVFDIECRDQLLPREHFLVAMRPAEAHQIIEQCPRQVTLLVVLQHAHRAVALRELGAVRP